MKVNLANFLRQAADCIDPAKDGFGYEWFLREEIPRLIHEVQDGKATVQQFCELFCIVPSIDSLAAAGEGE